MSKKKKLIGVVVGVALIAVLIVAVVLRAGVKSRDKMKDMSTKLQTTPLQKMDLTSSVSVTGTIASADSRSITSGLNDVEITSVAVSVGDYVKAGDVICTFDSATIEDELKEAQSEYSLQSKKSNKTMNDAKDSISDAESTYEDGVNSGNDSINEAKEAYDNAVTARDDAKDAYEKAGDAVKTAKKAYEKVKDKRTTLKANMEAAQKTYEEAKANYEKASEVTDVDLTSNIYDTYKNAEAAYEQAKAEYDRVEQSKQNYENAKQQKTEKKDAYDNAETEVSNAYSKYEAAQNEAAKQNAKNAETITARKEEYSITATETSNNLENQKNKVDQVADKLDDCVVTSPISGVVTSVLVEVGDTYKGEEIAIIQDSENFVVDATVDEYDIGDIAKGMKAVIKTDATGDEELEGEVTFVAPTPNSTQGNAGNSSNTSNYSIQITLKDKNERLRVGMTAKTSIILGSASDVYAVAYDCVETDQEGAQKVVLVSDKLVENMFDGDYVAALESTIDVNLNNRYYTYTIVGVYEYEENSTFSQESDEDVTTTVYMPFDTARNQNHTTTGYSQFTVVTNTDVDTSAFMEEVEIFFNKYYSRNENYQISVTSMESMLSSMTEMLDTISIAISIIAGISLLVGGIGVMNIMLVSITERTREIGTRKALGATNGSIRLQFIMESIVICLLGGFIGIILGLVLGAIVVEVMGYAASPSVGGIIFAVSFSIFIGVFFGYYPANKAAQLNPIDALRYE